MVQIRKSRAHLQCHKQEFILGETKMNYVYLRTFVNEEGVKFVKPFILKKVQYDIGIEYKVENQQIKH